MIVHSFKDTVDVLAFDDPEVSNVTLYISDMKRSISDRMSKDFFNDPSAVRSDLPYTETLSSNQMNT